MAKKMKRLVAMLLMIAFAWGGMVTAAHAVSICGDGSASITAANDSSHPAKPVGDMDAHHCAPACHAGAALLPSLEPMSVSALSSQSVEFSSVGSTGHVLAIPTPPPSLS
jgi:hypothetical protein